MASKKVGDDYARTENHMASSNIKEELKELWNKALEEYQKDTDHKITTVSISVREGGFPDLERDIQATSTTFDIFRSKNRRAYRLFQKFLTPLAIIAKPLGGIDASLSIGVPVGVVLGAFVHLVETSQKVTEAYDFIENIFTELQQYTEQISIYISAAMPDPWQRKISQILITIVRIIGKSEAMIETGRFKQWCKQAFLGHDKDMKDLVDRLNRALQNEQALLNAYTYKNTLETREMIAANFRQHTQDALDQQAIKKIEYAFRTPAVEATLEEYRQNREYHLKGTGLWLFDEPIFRNWDRQKTSLLTVLGGPGCGKSVLATCLIDRLSSTMDCQDNIEKPVHVAYFYMQQGKKDLSDIRSMLKTMVWQLQESDELFRKHIATVCRRSNLKIAGAREIWEDCLLDYYTSSQDHDSRAVLVLDGIGEGEDTLELADILADCRYKLRASRSNLQLAFFGRATLREHLRFREIENKSHYIEISPEKNSEDLKAFIHYRVQRLKVVQAMKYNREIAREAMEYNRRIAREAMNEYILELQDQISRVTAGIFLWARMILDKIQRLVDKGDIAKLLSDRPNSLDDMIIQTIKPLYDSWAGSDTIARILLWVSGSQRPLTFGELEIMMQIEGKDVDELWYEFREGFANVFKLSYPRGYDADADVQETYSTTIPLDSAKEKGELISMAHADSHSATDESIFDVHPWHSESANGLVENKSIDYHHRPSLTPVRTADQLYTIVEFTNSHFRDIIKEKGMLPEAERVDLPMLKYIRNTNFEMFVICVKMMQRYVREGDILKQELCLHYPSSNVFLHLEAISIDDISAEEQKAVLEGLYMLLTQPLGGRVIFLGLGEDEQREWDGLWQIWFTNGSGIKTVQHWLQIALSIGYQAQDDWIRNASTSAISLLQPLAQAAAKSWLVKEGYDDTAYGDECKLQIWFLKAYTNMNHDGRVPSDIANFVWNRDGKMERLSQEEIETLAEWAGLDKTTHWYTGLGRTFFQAMHWAKALECCERAIELDPNAWIAMEIRARCIAQNGDIKTAVEKIRETMQVVPVNMSRFLAYHEAYCSMWLRQLGRIQESHDMAERAFHRNPDVLPAIHARFQAMRELENWEEILQMMRSLDRKSRPYNTTVLTSYIVKYASLPPGAGMACRKGGNPKFVLKAAEASLHVIRAQADEIDTIKYMCRLARFRYKWYDEDEQPMEMLEEANNIFRNADQAVQDCCQKFIEPYVNKYTQICFDIAVKDYGSATSLSGKAYMKLKSLATVTSIVHQGNSEEMFEYFSTDYPSLLLGRLLREYSHSTEKIWKQCYRSRVLKLLDELDDDDPENDTSACQNLAVTLFQADDRKSAEQILAILFKPLEGLLTGKLHAEAELNKMEVESTAMPSDGVNTKFVYPTVKSSLAAGELLSSLSSLLISPEANAEDPQDTLVAKTRPGNPTISQVAEKATQPVETLELHLKKSWGYRCRGCKIPAERSETMWFCEICWETNFCSDCLSQVKDGTLPSRHCNPNHAYAWYQAWPIPEGRFESMAFSQVAGDVKLKKEWLERLRDNWRLNDGTGVERDTTGV